jgi:hypothetical protein
MEKNESDAQKEFTSHADQETSNQMFSKISVMKENLFKSFKNFQESYLQTLRGHSSDFFIRFICVILALLSISGFLNYILALLGWHLVLDSAYSILNDSLKSAATHIVGLMFIKGLLELFSTIQLGLIFANVSVGEFLQGPLAIIDLLFRFFIASTGLITAQISLLKLIELVGLSTLGGIGFICLALQPNRQSLFGRLGRLLLITGLVLYFVFPAILASVGKAYETYRIETEIQNKENIAVLSQQAGEISIQSLCTRDSEGRDAAKEIFTQGISTVWNGFLSLLVSYILLFIFLPLAGLGFCYLIISQAMVSLDYGAQVESMERGRQSLANWVSHGNKGNVSKETSGQ